MTIRTLHVIVRAISISLFAFCSANLFASAELCRETKVTLGKDISATRASVVESVSASSHRSILAEFAYTDRQITLDIPKGTYTLSRLSQLLEVGFQMVCVVENSVFHLYDPRVLELRQNGLSYRFADFPIPDDADMFVMVLRSRLHQEALAPETGPRGFALNGVTIPGLEPRPLRGERLEALTAREVFLSVAEQQAMTLVIEIPLRIEGTVEETWRKSSTRLQLHVTR